MVVVIGRLVIDIHKSAISILSKRPLELTDRDLPQILVQILGQERESLVHGRGLSLSVIEIGYRLRKQ